MLPIFGKWFFLQKTTRKFSKSSCLNKTSMCWTFINTKKCPWGDECIFAHGKKELRPMPKWFKRDQNSNQKVCRPIYFNGCYSALRLPMITDFVLFSVKRGILLYVYRLLNLELFFNM